MKLLSALCGGTLCALLLTTTQVRADPSIGWSFTGPAADITLTPTSGTGNIIFPKNPGQTGLSDGQTITATFFDVASSAEDAAPDMYSAGYSVSFNIKDDGGESAKLTISGVLNGTATNTNINLGNTFTGLSLNDGASSGLSTSFTLDGHTYTVSFDPNKSYKAPTIDNKGEGEIDGFVTVAGAGGGSETPEIIPGDGGGGQISQTPEPSSLVLAGLGLGSLLGGCRRRRKLAARE